MSPTIEKLYLPANVFANEPAAGEANSKLNVAVIFTSIESTLSALRRAGALASRLRASITLIVPQIVPYPLPLTSPPVPPDFTGYPETVLSAPPVNPAPFNHSTKIAVLGVKRKKV